MTDSPAPWALMQAGAWPRRGFALVDRGFTGKKSLEAGLGAGTQQQKIPSRSRGRKKQPWATEILLPSARGWSPVLLSHSHSALPAAAFHPSLLGLHRYFPSSQHTGMFFENQRFLSHLTGTCGPLPAELRALPECEAAAGPTPGGTVSPSVYTFLRAIALGRLCEPGTQPGAVLVTLKFLLQFCQI